MTHVPCWVCWRQSTLFLSKLGHTLIIHINNWAGWVTCAPSQARESRKNAPVEVNDVPLPAILWASVSALAGLLDLHNMCVLPAQPAGSGLTAACWLSVSESARTRRAQPLHSNRGNSVRNSPGDTRVGAGRLSAADPGTAVRHTEGLWMIWFSY